MSQLVNEDRFELPDSWRQKILPDRDRHRPASAPRIRQGDVNTARETISPLIPQARRMVAASPSPVRDADPASPLGVAAMTLAMLSVARADWRTRGELQQTLPQLWLAQMSLPSAVSCAAGLAGLCLEEDGEQMIVRPAGTGDTSQEWTVSWTWAAEALRTPVAACDDATHEQVVEVLTSYASAEPLQRLVAAYLAPDRGDWAQAALEGADPLPVMALAVPHTGDQLLGLLDRVPSYSVGGTGFTNLVTAVDRIGADALPTLKALLDDDPDAAEARNYYSLIAELPSDEALDLLIEHIDDPRAGASVLTATDRRPGPALDLLARRASAGRGTAELLAARVRSDRDLAAEVADRLPAGAAARIREVLAQGDHPDADPSQLPALLVSPPWAGKRSRKTQTVIEGLEAPDDTRLDWLPGEQEEWLTVPNYQRGHNPPVRGQLAAARRSGAGRGQNVGAPPAAAHQRPRGTTAAIVGPYDDPRSVEGPGLDADRAGALRRRRAAHRPGRRAPPAEHLRQSPDAGGRGPGGRHDGRLAPPQDGAPPRRAVVRTSS
ncbi:MAG: hypothetical protein SOH99_09735 [Acidipropionibacterium acidipropionici]|uniref:hypothetical protein n=1 Tax=Acidipropionibacterium acidipropionici TaxID=1748 RepID=UPI002F36032C